MARSQQQERIAVSLGLRAADDTVAAVDDDPDPVADTAADEAADEALTPSDEDADEETEPAIDPETEEDSADGDGDETPAPKAKAKPGAKTEAAPMPEAELTSLQERAKFGDDINTMFTTDAPKLAQIVLSGLTAEQRTALLAAMGAAPGAQAAQSIPGLPDDIPDEEMTVPERLAWRGREFLTKGQEQVRNLATNVARDIQQERQLNHYHALVAKETFAAIGQFLGMDLPQPDMAEVDALMQKGKSLEEAVAQSYGAKVTHMVKALKTRPKTVGGGSGGAATGANPPRDLKSIMREG